MEATKNESMTQVGELLYYQDKLIVCPKCKDGKIFRARDGHIKPCREC